MATPQTDADAMKVIEGWVQARGSLGKKLALARKALLARNLAIPGDAAVVATATTLRFDFSEETLSVTIDGKSFSGDTLVDVVTQAQATIQASLDALTAQVTSVQGLIADLTTALK